MADLHDVPWTTCTHQGCNGVRLPSGGRCWAHAAEEDRDSALKSLTTHGRLDARGVHFTPELLQLLLAAAPKDDRGHTVLAEARFDHATFSGNALFERVTFSGEATFLRATFDRDARFFRVVFNGDATFAGAMFHRDARLARTAFNGYTSFNEATFNGIARFSRATFFQSVRFDAATFRVGAFFEKATFNRASFIAAIFDRRTVFTTTTFNGFTSFERAVFNRLVRFTDASFRNNASFSQVTFQHIVKCSEARFAQGASFDGATFQRARQLGPMFVRKSLVLDEAVFHERIRIEVSAAALCCQRTRFLAGVHLRVRWAQVVLEDADLSAPSILESVPPFPDFEEDERWTRAMFRLRPLGQRRTRLISVRRADVAGLTVAHVDLSACRFAGAHHLDQLRLDKADLATAPQARRWTPRRTIAEEHHWRATQPPRRHRRSRTIGWYATPQQPPAWLDVEDAVDPEEIATLYRALRKGREDNKDEPGAADFYYGEMEMRRNAAGTPQAERRVLTLYWLLSGYALRASRAIGWLGAILMVTTLLLATFGLDEPTWSFPARLGTASLIALEGAVFRTSEQDLTYAGTLIQATLRCTGPVLLGLAALSIRGRVKR